MSRAYKNFWSLNTDEAVVTGILRDGIGKSLEVFMPLNAQMKDVDLVCMNLNNKKALTIQVKGSKAYEPEKERKRVGIKVKKIGGNTSDGSSGWFFLKGKNVINSTADYHIFLVYVIVRQRNIGRRTIEPHTIIMSTNELRSYVKEYKKLHGDRYSFYFWINPKKKIAFDWRDKPYLVNRYLDTKGLRKLESSLY